MGKASSSKKVARAAGTGSGRAKGGSTPVTWYATLLVIVAVGGALLFTSRHTRVEKLDKIEKAAKAFPVANQDHIHVAYGVYVCDKFIANVQDQTDPQGVHTHGDGVIHIHPSVSAAAGDNSTFGRFTEAIGAKVSATKIEWPGEPARENGGKCGEAPAVVKAFLDGKEVSGDPTKAKLQKDRAKFVLAFVPKDTGYDKIGDPPSVPALDTLTDVAPQTDPSSGSGSGTAGATTDATTTDSTAAPATSAPPATDAAGTTTTAKP